MTALLTRCLRRDAEGDVHEVGQVLWYEGRVHLIAVEPGGDEAIRWRLVDYQVVGVDRVLEPSDGPDYMQGIPQTLYSSRFWATDVSEVSDEAAAELATRATILL